MTAPPSPAPPAPPVPHDPTPEEIAALRTRALQELTDAQTALDEAARAHEEFRTSRWLPTPRRRRFPLISTKDALRDALDQARAHRDALLTAPLTLVALTPAQREQATHLSREGRRRIERAHGVPPVHPFWAPEQDPPQTSTPKETPTS